MHDMPLDPTPDTLSFYVVYMSHHIEPRSVDSYLSGICNQLEPYFPNVRVARKSDLVSRTLKGCKRLRSKPIHRKLPLSRQQISGMIQSLDAEPSYDDLLWASMLATGFFGLLRLAEMCTSDSSVKRNPRKYCRRLSVKLLHNQYEFTLRTHKADKFFEGNQVIVNNADALSLFRRYLTNRDTLFPLNPFLWLQADGSVPTRSWFITKLRAHIPDNNFAGQSLRAGGATALAEDGASLSIYIRKHPTLLHTILRNTHS
ncbi:hypothetical protein EV361DRAFT_972395 [Lentinula raphanica]|nr:hypothetical protein EV361DRAFT_972395 [Lentinula raphanica]